MPLAIPGSIQDSDPTALLDPARTSEILRRQPLEPDGDESLESLDSLVDELADVTVRGPAELAKRQLLVKTGHVLAGIISYMGILEHAGCNTYYNQHVQVCPPPPHAYTIVV